MSEIWTSELLNFGAEQLPHVSVFIYTIFLERSDILLMRIVLSLSSVVLLLSCSAVNHCGGLTFLVIHALFTSCFSLAAAIKLLVFCALLPLERVFHSCCVITDLYLNFLPLLHVLFDFFTVTESKKGNNILQTQNYSLDYF